MHFLFQNRNESRFTIKAFIRLCHALHVSEQLGENGPYWFSRNVCHADMRRELIRVFLAWVPFTFDLIRDSTSMTEQEGGYSLPRHLPGYLPAGYPCQQDRTDGWNPGSFPPLSFIGDEWPAGCSHGWHIREETFIYLEGVLGYASEGKTGDTCNGVISREIQTA